MGDSEPTQNWFVNIESKLTKIEKTIDEAIGKLSEQIPTKVSDLENDLAVSYFAQELTSEQKQQVRENIDIGVSKKVVTYNGAKRSFTVGVIEGTIADLPEDSASEYLEAYKNFWHVCEYMRMFKLTTWQFAKNALKWLSSAHKNNIISDSLIFYVTKPSKYIKYSYNVNAQGRAYDLMEYYDEGATLKLSYYPDTDEFEDNQMDAKWSKPITMNSYGLDNNTISVEQFELSKNPTSDMEVATKKYVDDNIGVSKKVITYDGSSSYTILISEGTVNDIKSDSTEEFIEGYKTFYSAIQQTRFVETPYWRGLKTLLKKLSDAHRVGIISDKLTYSVDQSFTEINYSYGKARDNKYFDCIVFINNGKKARLSYYPDTDEYSTNDSDNYIKEALIKNTNGTDSTNSSVYQFNMDEDPTSDMQVATKQYVDKNSTKIDETLTTEQKATIRDNINAIGYDPIEIPLENNNTVTIYHVYGTFTPPTDENKNDTDYQSVYKTFTNQFIICRIIATLNWQLAKNMVKAFSAAYDKGIISENFMFYSDDIYSKLTKFERTVNSDGTKVDTLRQDYRGKLVKLIYYPDTDTFSENSVDSCMEQPLMLYTAGFDKDYAAHQFKIGRDPQNNMEIATKQYVDNNTMFVVQGRDCPESLDTMTDTGYCYIDEYTNPYPSDFPDIADKTKNSMLICYRQIARGYARQILYNGNDKVFTRYGYPEMGNIIWNDWTDLTSSSIMYIHVTSEEKDGETVFKSDKTYEEIKEAVDSGKSPVAIYEDALFFTLDTNIPGNVYIFTNSIGAIGIGIDHDNNTTSVICCGMPPYVTITWSVNNMDIHVQIVNDALTNLTTDIDAYCQTCQQFGKNPAIELRVRKTNGMDLSYDVLLYYTGNDFAGTTFINGNLTYCRLTMKDMSDTSTWEYTETEIPELYASMPRYVSTDNIVECMGVYKDEDGILYSERSVKYYDTMDKVCTNNTINGNIAIVKSKGNSDIDIPYPVIVYSSTIVQEHGQFDGWIVDACGNHYKCAIGGSWVTLGELMTRGIPQPSEKDANKVLCGDMTWKDAQNITDEHINTLIDKKLGVIENGTY